MKKTFAIFFSLIFLCACSQTQRRQNDFTSTTPVEKCPLEANLSAAQLEKKDGKIFVDGLEVKSIEDPATFELITYVDELYFWAKDKTKIYFFELGPYGGDAWYKVYPSSGDDTTKVPKDLQIDKDSFEPLSLFFYRDKDHIYSSDGEEAEFFLLNEADRASFKVFCKTPYAFDKANVYEVLNDFEGHPLEAGYSLRSAKDIDTASLSLINQKYIKDKNSAYYHLTVIKDSDPSTFEIMEDDHYAKDKNHVYFQGEVIPEADPKTFETIVSVYSKDAQHVFYTTQIVPEATPQEIQPQGEWGIKDKKYQWDSAAIKSEL